MVRVRTDPLKLHEAGPVLPGVVRRDPDAVAPMTLVRVHIGHFLFGPCTFVQRMRDVELGSRSVRRRSLHAVVPVGISDTI